MSNSHLHPFACTWTSQKSILVLTWYSVGQGGPLLLQVLHQPINRHVEKKKAKMRGILEKEGRDSHYSIFISLLFFTEMLGYLYSYHSGANITSDWKETLQIHIHVWKFQHLIMIVKLRSFIYTVTFVRADSPAQLVWK